MVIFQRWKTMSKLWTLKFQPGLIIQSSYPKMELIDRLDHLLFYQLVDMARGRYLNFGEDDPIAPESSTYCYRVPTHGLSGKAWISWLKFTFQRQDSLKSGLREKTTRSTTSNLPPQSSSLSCKLLISICQAFERSSAQCHFLLLFSQTGDRCQSD